LKYDNLELTTELALIKAIYFFVRHKLKPGRLANRVDRLNKAVDKILDNKIKLNDYQVKISKSRIDRFQRLLGWDNRERHMLSLVSFSLALIEESDFNYQKYAPKIIQCLNDIYDYFDRGNNAHLLCCVSGEVAMDKWRIVINENDIQIKRRCTMSGD